jgi:light-regulated signal transduction histidine kinase (bacteriophytochrome)
LLGLGDDFLAGLSLHQLVETRVIQPMEPLSESGPPLVFRSKLLPYNGPIGFSGLAHVRQDRLLLEFTSPESLRNEIESAVRGADSLPALRLQRSLQQMQEAATLEDLLSVAVEELLRGTCHDCALVCRTMGSELAQFISETGEHADDSRVGRRLSEDLFSLPVAPSPTGSCCQVVADSAAAAVPLHELCILDGCESLSLEGCLFASPAERQRDCLKQMGIAASVCIPLNFASR